jgi:crotonobetainyl-CoA:carnitine CoA-transferase CaiB-like acyl-CoA transferase
MTEALAGPYCCMMLGDLGADVIKVERKQIGDQTRSWGPPFVEGESAYFLSVNRNKRSLALDIKDTSDLQVLHQLIATADVFVTNNPRMASLKRVCLDPATLRDVNPGLIYVAISGYGHTGPKANRAGYDVIAQGEAGLMALTGEPGEGPKRFPTPIADITAGIYSTMGTLTALYSRDNSMDGSGRGQFIDVSLLDSQITWLANLGASYLIAGKRPEKMGNLHPTITPYQPLKTGDRPIIVAVGTEPVWRRFCKVLGIEGNVMEDPRFATNPLRNSNRGELIPLLEGVLETECAEHWLEVFIEEQIPAGPINFPEHILNDPHPLARGMVVELEHPLVGLVRTIGNPIHLSDTPPTYRRYPPLLGEHNEELIAELSRVSG